MKSGKWSRLWLLLALVWIGVTGVSAYNAMSPLYVKKRVTVTLNGVGTVRFVFSNAQAHNEIIYEMKSEWAPRMAATPQAFVDQTITSPYDLFVRAHAIRLGLQFGLIALVPPLVLLALAWFWSIRRTRPALAPRDAPVQPLEK
jgi:hypothetical protein